MKKRMTAILLIAIMAMSVLAIAPAAALDDTTITYDTSADSEGDLVGDDTDVIETFNASSDDYTLLAVEIDTSTTADLSEVSLNVTLEDEETTTSHYEATNDSPTSTAAWLSTDHEGVTINISHDDLDTIPIQANGSETVDFGLEFEAGDDDEVVTDEFEVVLEATTDYSVMYLGEETEEYDDVVDHDERDPGFFSLADDIPDHFTIEDDRDVYPDDGTEIVIHLDGDMAADYNDVAADADTDELLIGFAGYDEAEDLIIPVFADSADTDWVDEDDDTYAVFDSSADTLTIHVGEDYDDDELELVAVNTHLGSLDMVGFSDIRDAGFGVLDTVRLTFGMSMMAGAGTALSIAIIAGLRRRKNEE